MTNPSNLGRNGLGGLKWENSLAQDGESMQVTISSGNNINGTLVLPLFEGEEALPEIVEGIPSTLKSQINRVLADGDFKAKANATMTLVGTEGGKAMLVGLGKEDKADVHAYREAGAQCYELQRCDLRLRQGEAMGASTALHGLHLAERFSARRLHLQCGHRVLCKV